MTEGPARGGDQGCSRPPGGAVIRSLPRARGLRWAPRHAVRLGRTRGHVGRRRWVIELEGVPELIDPVMVAAFEGWNDAGDAASTAVAHLDREWKGEVFAALD